MITRHNFDAEIPLPELVDYYMPGFKSCVQEGRALGIMCSYNAVNGVPMCGNRMLLTDVLRDQWGFDGYVTSDCGAINDIQAISRLPVARPATHHRERRTRPVRNRKRRCPKSDAATKNLDCCATSLIAAPPHRTRPPPRSTTTLRRTAPPRRRWV